SPTTAPPKAQIPPPANRPMTSFPPGTNPQSSVPATRLHALVHQSEQAEQPPPSSMPVRMATAIRVQNLPSTPRLQQTLQQTPQRKPNRWHHEPSPRQRYERQPRHNHGNQMFWERKKRASVQRKSGVM